MFKNKLNNKTNNKNKKTKNKLSQFKNKSLTPNPNKAQTTS